MWRSCKRGRSNEITKKENIHRAPGIINKWRE
jgi:hypothetical protein